MNKFYLILQLSIFYSKSCEASVCQPEDYSLTFLSPQSISEGNNPLIRTVQRLLTVCRLEENIIAVNSNHCFGHCYLQTKCAAVTVSTDPLVCRFCIDFGHGDESDSIIDVTNVQVKYTVIRDLADSCLQLYAIGLHTDGIYSIADNDVDRIDVFCEMDTNRTDGSTTSGWTVIQRRVNGDTDFYRNWDEYASGFGNLSENFWLGLDNIAALTRERPVELLVYLEDFENETVYAHYSTFAISNSSDNYRLTVSGYIGTAGDSLGRHNGHQFSTRDRDNDIHGDSCAVLYTGAWWYDRCHASNLNGQYLSGTTTTYANGMVWYAYRGYHYSLKTTVMKIR